MISEETEILLKRLLAEQTHYLPRREVAAQIAGKTFICLVGATCMGKSTIMDGLIARDGQYGAARTIATRPPRPTDEPGRYTYYEHTDTGLAPLLRRIENREVLQYAIIPGSLSIRASEATDYPYEYNLGDVVSSAISSYERLGFGRLEILNIVTEPEAWLERFKERFPSTHPDHSARLQEAIASLTWSLEQATARAAWIINHEGRLSEAVEAADRAIRYGECTDQEEARALGMACLNLARELAA